MPLKKMKTIYKEIKTRIKTLQKFFTRMVHTKTIHFREAGRETKTKMSQILTKTRVIIKKLIIRLRRTKITLQGRNIQQLENSCFGSYA